MASTFVGTMLYLSPERITGESFSYNSDVWSFGVSLIYLATGSLNLPKDYWALLNYVKGPPPSLDRKLFPELLCDFVDACLTKDPLLRPSAATLLKHPFITTPDQPGLKLADIWPFTTGKDPNEKELELLVQAVIDRYYLTPAQIAGGMTAPTSDGKTIFTMSTIDQQRISTLAQQLAWNIRPLQEAFIRKLVAKGESLGGVQGEASIRSEDDYTPVASKNVRSSNSFSSSGNSHVILHTNSSTTSSTSAVPSANASGASSSSIESNGPPSRLNRLSRQKSVTLDQDPQFNGEFGILNGGVGGGTSGNTLTSSGRFSSNPRPSPSSLSPVSSPSPFSPESSLSSSSSSSSNRRLNPNPTTSSPHRPVNVTSYAPSPSPNPKSPITPSSAYTSSEEESPAPVRTRAKAGGFDSNAKIRHSSYQQQMQQMQLQQQQHQQRSSSNDRILSPQTSLDRRVSSGSSSGVRHLSKQLEDLMEDESD